MTKNTLIGILGAAVVALLVIVAFLAGKGCGHTRPETEPDSTNAPPTTAETNAPVKPLPTSVERELPALKKGDTQRIPPETAEPQDITSLFEAEGKGTYAAWGGAADADFYYMLKLAATSKVESKEESESGKVRVEEIRTFREATEVMKPANVRLRIDLSTVPLDQIEKHALLLSGVVSLFSPDAGMSLTAQIHDLREQIDSLDGLDAQPVIELLNEFGIDLQQIINKPVEKYLNGILTEIHSHVNAVQGKSYRFIYWTDKEGEPLRVRYENTDNSPISIEEQNVLNYVNLFIDCHILPDKNCRPGQHWKVGASAVASMFGAVADGTCVGDVDVTRGDDMPDGNWSLTIAPATISLYSDDHRPIGNVKLNGGKAVGDASRAILRELQLDGHGKLRKRDSGNLWIYEFVTKIDGDCKFRSTLLPRRED